MGAALLHLGSSYLDENELRARALTWSDWLAARTNETVRLGTLHDAQVLVVHHVFRPDNSPQTLEIGRLLPVHATALGKVLLAHHSYLMVAVANDGPLHRITASTITDLRLLAAEV
jgi:DNA-binding IclR family transcriptional regulator